MRIPFLTRKPEANLLAVPLPALAQVAFEVYARFEDDFGAPSAEAVLPLVGDWLRQHADEPLRSACLAALQAGALRLTVEALPLDQPRPAVRGDDERLVARVERRLAGATHRCSVAAHGPLKLPRVDLWLATGAARALALGLSGVIVDPEAGPLVELAVHSEAIPADGRTLAPHHIAARVLGAAGQRRIVTEGMGKFGLPNLQLRGVPEDAEAALLRLVAAVAHYLAAAAMKLNADSDSPQTSLALGPGLRLSGEALARAWGEEPPAPAHDAPGWTMIGLAYPAKDAPPGAWRIDLVPPEGFSGTNEEWPRALLADLYGAPAPAAEEEPPPAPPLEALVEEEAIPTPSADDAPPPEAPPAVIATPAPAPTPPAAVAAEAIVVEAPPPAAETAPTVEAPVLPLEASVTPEPAAPEVVETPAPRVPAPPEPAASAPAPFAEELAEAERQLRLDRADRAATIVMDVIWKQPDNANAYLLLARALARKGDPVAAREAVDQAAELAPDHPQLRAARMQIAAASPTPPRPAPAAPAPAPAAPPPMQWVARAPGPVYAPPVTLADTRLPETEGPPGALALLLSGLGLAVQRPLAWGLMLVAPAMAVSYGASSLPLTTLSLPPPARAAVAGYLLVLCGAFTLLAMCGVYVFGRLFPAEWTPTPGRLIRYAILVAPPVWGSCLGGWWAVQRTLAALPSGIVHESLVDLLGAAVGIAAGSVLLLPFAAPALCAVLTEGTGIFAAIFGTPAYLRGRAGAYVAAHWCADVVAVVLGLLLYSFFSMLLGDPASAGPTLCRGAALGVALTVIAATAAVTGLDAIAVRQVREDEEAANAEDAAAQSARDATPAPGAATDSTTSAAAGPAE